MISRTSNGDGSGSSNGDERQRTPQSATNEISNEIPFHAGGGGNAAQQSAAFPATETSYSQEQYDALQQQQQQIDPYYGMQQEQQQLYQYQQQQMEHQQQQPSSAIPRSSPIAIVRSSPGEASGIMNRRAGTNDDDDDDDDSEIDVEKDAIKLQEKYGATIVAQTFQATTTTSTDHLLRKKKAESVLNAPYLGSLSRSANQVLSLPPMSLAGGSMFQGMEPPETTTSTTTTTSYGSLRDSHERGTFLDGPSSYREPTSGRIRQLDHRLRYHSRTTNELSIGERLQQSRKLKEVRQKELAKTKEGSASSSSNDQASGLSAMMNEASNNKNTGDDTTDTPGSFGEEILMPIKTGDGHDETPTFRDNDSMDAPSMLSTSLTAFEMLKMSNVPTSMSLQSGAARTSFAALAPHPDLQDDDQRRFLPLARSMSDPTHQMRQLSLRDQNHDLSQTAATAAARASGLGGWAGNTNPQAMQMMPSPPQQQYPPDNDAFGYAAVQPPATEHDPDTDGAFGDMDL